MGVRTKLVISTVLLAAMMGVGVAIHAVFIYRAAIRNEIATQGVAATSHWGRHLNELAEKLGSINDKATLQELLSERDILAAYAVSDRRLRTRPQGARALRPYA